MYAHATLPTRTVVPSRRHSRLPLVVCKKNERSGGIHDPIFVGQGEKTAAKMTSSQEEQRRLMQQRLQQQQTPPVGAGTGSLKASAQRELLGVEQEKAKQQARPKSLQSMEADEEYKRMHPVQKWWYEAMAALFNWEKDGSVGGL